MFSEQDLVEAVERHLQQWAQTCRGVWIARARDSQPARRTPLRARLERAAAPAGTATLAAEAAAWRRSRRQGAPLPRPAAGAESPAPATPAGLAPSAAEAVPIALFLPQARAIFLTVKQRRFTAIAEAGVSLSPAERMQHRRLRDCGFAVHVIAAETPGDARDQVTALLRRLGFPVNG